MGVPRYGESAVDKPPDMEQSPRARFLTGVGKISVVYRKSIAEAMAAPNFPVITHATTNHSIPRVG